MLAVRKPIIYVAVVDDDENFCRSLTRLLRAENYHPVTYASAEEFLADSARPKFDCLLLDITLGGISGLDLARRLTAVGSDTPVVFISARTDGMTRAQALDAGGAALVGKTEPKEVLLESLAAVMAGRKPPGAPIA